MQKPFDHYVVLDLETTGVDPSADSIIEIAAVRVQDGIICDTFESLVRFEGTLDPMVTLITGIGQQDVAEAPPIELLLPETREFIGELPVVGHNIPFDIAFLRAAGMEIASPQWDTSVLAAILFPHLRSHSLESLSNIFSISHQAHRAMGDVRATAALWQILMAQIANFDDSRRKKVAHAVAGSSWDLRDIWSMDAAAAEKHVFSPKAVREKFHQIELPGNYASMVIECTGIEKKDVALRAINDLLLQKKRVLCSAGNFFTLDSIAHEIDSHAFLDRPSAYLDWKKFEEMMSRQLTPQEAVLAAKVLLHHDNGSMVHRGDLALLNEDYQVWDRLACDPQSSDFITVLDAAVTADVVFMTHSALFEHIRQHPRFPFDFGHLVMLDTHLIEASITRAFGTEISSETADPAASAFFEKVYAWIRSFLPASKYPESVLLRPEIAKKQFESLISEAATLEISGLNAFFAPINGNGDDIRWMKMFPDGRFFLHLSPGNVRSIFSASLLSRLPHLLIAERGAFLGELGDFSEHHQLVDESFMKTLAVHIPSLEEIIGTRSAGDSSAQQSYFLEQMKNISGPTAFVFSSRRVLQNFVLDLQPELVRRGIPYVAEGISGGRGKLLSLHELCAQAPSSIFFCTHRYLPLFEREDLEFQNIFLQSLPFDPPDPITQVRSGQKRNGFMEYSLPKAVHNFSIILDRLTLRPVDKHIFFLDRRVVEKEYAREFLRVVQPLTAVSG